jgi:hypothetical protein
MEEKVCSKCKITKPITEFHKNSYRKVGYRSDCKDCKKLLSKKYREEKKEVIDEYNKNYRMLKKEGYVFDITLLSDEERRLRHNLRCKKYTEKRLKSDSLYKLKVYTRKSIARSFTNYTKSKKYEDILGITYDKFKIYIESLFTEGMTWENYGEWQLDHKIPLSWAKTEEQVYELNKYTNFQPLWSSENQSKGNRYESM